MKRLMLMLLVVAMIVLVSCGSGGGTPTTTAPAPGDFSDYKRLEGTEVAVTIQMALYQPDKIIVSRGTKVTWTNKDYVPHTVTGEKFGSGDLYNEESFSYTFNEAGIYNYACNFHPQQRGAVKVE